MTRAMPDLAECCDIVLRVLAPSRQAHIDFAACAWQSNIEDLEDAGNELMLVDDEEVGSLFHQPAVMTHCTARLLLKS